MDERNQKKLRVLFAAPYKAIGKGGLIQWTENIVDYYNIQKDSDVELDVFPTGRMVPFNMGSTRQRIHRGILDYSQMIKKERRLLKSKQYDVMHLCTSASMSLLKDIVMIKLAKRNHVKTAIHFHFGRIPALKEANNWEWKLLRRVVKLVDVAVPMDQMSYDALVSSGFTNVKYLPNPVAKKVSDYVDLHEHEVQRDERMVFYAGHCKKEKGVYELVRACSEIENVRLVLAGSISSKRKEELKDIAHNGSWLEIMGTMSHEEVLHLMMQCGVFTLPSYTEGFPNVILESMACGCANVATTVGAIPEMIGEENGHKCGLLVPPQDVESLRTAIVKILSDKDLREECRQNGKRRVNERYNIEAVWQKMTDIWRYALNVQ